MEEYISKSTLVVEIERRINEINLDIIEDWRYRLQREHDIEVMKNILSLIDTLEVKEVDLEKSLTCFMSRYAYENGGEYPSAIDIAKHFYELGIKAAQKGE